MSVAPSTSPDWRLPPPALHAHGLRWGLRGAGGPGAPVDLRPGSPDGVWATLAAELGCAGWPVARMSQVHGVGLLEAAEGGVVGEADALFTTRPGLLLCVRVADCVPVLLAGPGVVAAVHAGWRGAAAGIVPAVLERLRADGLEVDRAWVGPSISAARYEVGEEVVEALAATGVPAHVFVDRSLGAKPRVAVAKLVEAQLHAAGGLRVAVDPACSAADLGLHSYRRDGAASGRMGAFIGRDPR